ncbi:MAG: copper resistance protein CopC/CopD [Chloroflexi bacterium]|nr:copper resistance protein CopC/CopD [Chloroflexota bacterium]
MADLARDAGAGAAAARTATVALIIGAAVIRPPRWWRLAGVIAVLALLAGPALPCTAGGRVAAHAHLVASSPGAGTIVQDSPDELRLVFSEPLELQFTSLDLVAEDGTVILERAGEIDANDPHALVVADVDLADGIYQLTWRTLSAADGHTAEGFFSFAVGPLIGTVPGPIGGGMVHTETDPARVVGRWVTYIGLLLAVGIAVFHGAVLGGGRMPRVLVRLLAAGLGISALATLGVAIAGALEVGSVLDYLVDSSNGRLQVARALVAGAGAGVLLVVPPRLAGSVAAGAGLAGITLLVGAGHASALPGPVAMLAQVVHVVGAAVWIGGIVGLLVLLLRPKLLSGVDARPAMRTLVPRFSALAFVSIGLVAMTGAYAAWVQTGRLVTVDTEYGRTLVLKSGLALGALALGGLNFLDGGRMRAWLDGMRSRLTLEAIVIAAVLLVTAALAITAPTEEVPGVAIEPVPDAFGETTPDLDLVVAPGQPGVNRVVVLTSEALASGSPSFELVLDRVDAATTSRVPLVAPGMAGMDHGPGGEMPGMYFVNDEGLAEWVADAVVLPAGSSWNASVVISSPQGTELTRQRFAFALDDAAIAEGRSATLLDPALGIAIVLFLGGAVGLGLGLGGMPLPRCEPLASRIALVGGGGVAAVLGAAIGASRLLG